MEHMRPVSAHIARQIEIAVTNTNLCLHEVTNIAAIHSCDA